MLIGREIYTNMFDWHPDMGLFTQEISSLGDRAFGWLCDDACDIGFVLVSEKTGKKIPFYLDETDYCDGGEDVAGWNFRPVTNDPKLSKLKVLIVND